MAQSRGKVAWFNRARGFGFITPPSGPDVFVHYSAIQGEGFKMLRESDDVEFQVENGPSGKPQAISVRKLEG